MPGKPQLHFQLTESSCVPACLVMVFGAYGREVSEFELREACGTDDNGTRPDVAAEVAWRDYGFTESFTDYLTLDQLLDELSRGLYPIAFLALSAAGKERLHAVVVVEIVNPRDDGVIRYLDPVLGRQERPLAEFTRRWSKTNGRTIIVQPPEQAEV